VEDEEKEAEPADAAIDMDHIPMSFGTVREIQGKKSLESFLVLYDSGATGTWVHSRRLPKGATPQMTDKITGSTMAGTFVSQRSVTLTDTCFPEFHRGRHIESTNAHVFDAPDC